MSPEDPQSKPPSEQGSLVVFVLAVLSVLGTVGLWISAVPIVVGKRESEFGVVFILVMGVTLGLATVACALVPSWVLHEKKRRRRDLLSLRLSAFSVTAICLLVVGVLCFGR